MPPFHRLLVLEFISAGGLADDSLPPDEHEALLAQGRAMRDALVSDLAELGGLSIACATAPHDDIAPHSGSVAEPRRPGETMAGFLQRVGPDYDGLWVIAPESDDVLASLARVAGATRWIGCRQDALRLCASKAATRRHLRSHGIAVPDEAPSVGDDAGHWIVKPDDGAGTLATRRHGRLAEARADVRRRLAAGASATLERWIDGTPMSLSLLATRNAVEVLAINEQGIVMAGDGTLGYHGVRFLRPPRAGADDALLRLASRIREAIPGLAGYVGVDLVIDGTGRATVIEINPRLTCAYIGLARRLGRPLAAEILADAGLQQPTEDALDPA